MLKMYSNQPKVLARPRSSLSTDEHLRTKGSTVRQQRRKPSVTVVSLIGLSFFLFLLCACLITLLVLVGKNYSRPGHGNSTNYQELSSLTNSEEINEKNSAKVVTKPKITFKPNLILKNPDEQPATHSIAVQSATGGVVDSVIETGAENTATTTVLSERSPKILFESSSSSSSLAELETKVDEKNCKAMAKAIQSLSYRLPREIRPLKYSLYLHPNLKEKIFSGNVTIHLEVLKPISYIVLNSKKLNISNPTLERIRDKKMIDILKSYDCDKYEYFVNEIGQDLEIGEYELKVPFSGSLADRIVGFYQSSYLNKATNETRSIATSKFEPTYARQAFPCFDEPDMKAKFEVSLVRPRDYIALSNMNELNAQEDPSGNVVVKFAESVPMSTYLACFIVSDFNCIEGDVNTNGIGDKFKMRVFSTPAQRNKIQYSLDTGIKVIEYYIKYFNLEYPLPKLDMAAIPDFSSGAMEHWGLVTFRETALLYDPEISSSLNKKRVGSVIAHELAHMWFGNLVTMKWWNDLWLNEGFATYMQFKGLAQAEPTWNMEDMFLIDNLHSVLKLDGTLASHPIVQTAETPDEITALFDAITYNKGASVIRMLEDFVDPIVFQKAVRAYLTEFKYKNAETQDLLNKIDELAPNKETSYIMETWTKQTGLPVVMVEKISDTKYLLKQKRFFANPEDEKKDQPESPFNYKWYIPITYTTSENPETVERLFFKNIDTEATIELKSPVKWVKLNRNQVGYYRVNYPKELWNELTNVLKDDVQVLSIADRAHLLNDAFSLANAQQLAYGIALDLLQYLENEKEYVPWEVALSTLLELRNLLYYTETNKDFTKYVRKLIKKNYDTVGWEVDKNDLQKNSLRVRVLGTACSFELPECVEEVKERFEEFLQPPNKRPKPDLRTIIYRYGMTFAGNEQRWDQLWNIFKDEADANEKLKLMEALAAIKDPGILSRYIQLAWDESNVRGQDYFTCLTYISKNRVGESIVWNYVRQNWMKLVKRFGLNDRYLGKLIPSITSNFATKQALSEMEIFFNEYPEAGAGKAARAEAKANVENNIKWLETNEKEVSEWLKTQS